MQQCCKPNGTDTMHLLRSGTMAVFWSSSKEAPCTLQRFHHWEVERPWVVYEWAQLAHNGSVQRHHLAIAAIWFSSRSCMSKRTPKLCLNSARKVLLHWELGRRSTSTPSQWNSLVMFLLCFQSKKETSAHSTWLQSPANKPKGLDIQRIVYV